MSGYITASETNNTFKHDDYMTPKSAWESIQHLIPTDKVIWEAFYGDGKSGTYLQELGFSVIHQDIDFFQHDLGDIIVSNPPFSKSKEVLQRLRALEKPFILILPALKIHTLYLRDLFRDSPDHLQVIVPRKRIHFKKCVNGEPVPNWKDATSFECFYYCWKMNLPRDIMWL
jgi:hypothetical protein